jgi:predicted transcriptional regulator
MLLKLNKPLRLGELELEVLEYLWANREGHVKQVHEGIGVSRNNTLNTIQSTLDRLYKKGLLGRTKVAHSYVYKCNYSRTEILTRKINDLAHELASGETSSVLAAFVEFTARLDASKISELETLIAAHKRNFQGDNHG